jgi:pilus assembly protein Flp/PilA
MIHHIRKFLRDEDGPTAVEYAVMLALIVTVCLVSINSMATETANSFDTSSAELSSVLGS